MRAFTRGSTRLLLLASLSASCSGGAAGDDGGSSPPDDLTMPVVTGDGGMGGMRDLVAARVDLAGPPSGVVTPSGGRVSRLLFGVTGDTRPASCDDVAGYPTSTISKIFSDMNAAGAQFALATGDHQYVCTGGYAGGTQQLKLYEQATLALPGKVVFPVMGNHECNETMFCPPGTSLGRFRAYMDVIVTPHWSLPYYSFDVQTDNGLARFVVAADTAWDAAEASWLDATLAAAATQARYVFVFRHYPLGTTFNSATVDPSLMDEERIIKSHHYTMLITGHTHQYRHDLAGDPSGRAVVMGLGGAPLTGAATYFGYLLVSQTAGGSLSVTVFDSASGNMRDAFTVTP